MNLTILLVDDEEIVLTMLATSLTRHGMKVIKAVDGVDALKQYNAHRDIIDGIVLDLNMPEKNGVEVMHELRAQDSEVPIWLSSGDSGADFLEESDREKVTGILSKPYSVKEFTQTLREHLGAE